MAKTCDPKCYALAKAFLDEWGWTWSEDTMQLAREIQEVIEDYMDNLKDLEEHDAGDV